MSRRMKMIDWPTFVVFTVTWAVLLIPSYYAVRWIARKMYE